MKLKATQAGLLLIAVFAFLFFAHAGGADFYASMFAYMAGMAGLSFAFVAYDLYHLATSITCFCGEQTLRTTTERYYDVETNVEHTYIGCSQVVPVWVEKNYADKS